MLGQRFLRGLFGAVAGLWPERLTTRQAWMARKRTCFRDSGVEDCDKGRGGRTRVSRGLEMRQPPFLGRALERDDWQMLPAVMEVDLQRESIAWFSGDKCVRLGTR